MREQILDAGGKESDSVFRRRSIVGRVSDEESHDPVRQPTVDGSRCQLTPSTSSSPTLFSLSFHRMAVSSPWHESREVRPFVLALALVLLLAPLFALAAPAFGPRGESNFVINYDEFTYRLSQSIAGLDLWTGPPSCPSCLPLAFESSSFPRSS